MFIEIKHLAVLSFGHESVFSGGKWLEALFDYAKLLIPRSQNMNKKIIRENDTLSH